MAVEKLGPAERFAAGAIGEPGKRSFFLEVVAGGMSHSFPCEKDQVAELAGQGLQILIAAGLVPDQEAVSRLIRSGLQVSDPEKPRFRIGSIGLGVTENEFITLQVGALEGEESVSFVVTPEQFQAMAVVALEVVASGRPICPRCSLPEDPQGHDCPSVNGHRSPAR